ncbi:hypothetical protein E2C01_091240 [Portunus trituberculatus]|uniref:Uncharacterized protein n=1 Tax=Portunus trituberculatus TaxID=210409 RepID=A0A5B7JNV3_PORTR|nr:hypothetical protein [Portunus trituberculatus]
MAQPLPVHAEADLEMYCYHMDTGEEEQDAGASDAWAGTVRLQRCCGRRVHLGEKEVALPGSSWGFVGAAQAVRATTAPKV